MATSTKKDTTVKAAATVGTTANTLTAPKAVGTATSSGVSAAKASSITPTTTAPKTSGYISDKNNIVSAANISAENQATLNQILAENGLSGGNSYNDAFDALKSNIGYSNGNQYNTTIGNATLNQYGYGVNEYGRIYKLDEPKQETGDGRPVQQDYHTNSTDLYNNYQGVRSDMNAATQALVDSINANKPQIEQTYQDQQKQAYINKVLQDAQMNDYLKSQGISGGMAESTALAAANAYDAQRQAAYQTKQQALTEIEKMVAEAKATGNTNLANAAMQYMSQYQQAMQHLDQMDYNYYSKNLDQFNIDRDFANNQSQQAYQNAWNERVYGDQLAQQAYQNQWNERVYGDNLAQQQYQNQFSQQQYNDQLAQQAYQNAWNERVYGDSQVQQQWENDFAKAQFDFQKLQAAKKSGGSSTGSKKTSTGSTTETSSPVTSDNQLSAQAQKIKNYLTASLVPGQPASTEKKAESLAWINDYYNSDLLTEEEARYIAGLIGITI